MTENLPVFDSEFHRGYVGGEGEIKPSKPLTLPKMEVTPCRMSDIEAEYRWYMNDPKAKLPADLEKHLLSIGTEDDREN